MLSVSREGDSLYIVTSSQNENVGDVIQECLSFLGDIGQSNSLRVYIVLRELLKNAIHHGNGLDKHKTVSCQLKRQKGTKLIIEVADQGEGFDSDSLDFSLPENAKNISKRGLALVKALSILLSFNKKGNVVTSVLHLKPEENGSAELT